MMRKKSLMIVAMLAILLMVPVNVMASNNVMTIAKANISAKKVSNGWTTVDGKTFYYKDGKLVTGWEKINNKWFYFSKVSSKKGTMLTGWRKIDGKMYYLRKKGKNKGAMLTGWKVISKQTFYFGGTEDGVLRTGLQKINGRNFYFQPKGAKAVQGRMLTGWQTIGSKRYYFKKVGGFGVKGQRFQNGTYKINGTTYYFNAKGVETESKTSSPDYVLRKDPVDGKTWKVEPEFDTDPQVGSKNITEEAFMAALIYTEGGDQGADGQLMVAMCVLNRVVDKKLGYYPNSLKFVVYENGQYAVARKVANGGTGTLTKELKIIQKKGYTWWKNSFATKKQCAISAQTAFKKINDWKKNPSKNPRTINKKVTKLIKESNKKYGVKSTKENNSFDHTFFMTPGAFSRLGLSASKSEKFDYKGHVFFRYWKR